MTWPLTRGQIILAEIGLGETQETGGRQQQPT
jgi:hypothetical protein